MTALVAFLARMTLPRAIALHHHRSRRHHVGAENVEGDMRQLLTILTDWALGPSCPTCGERRRGPRTLAVHRWTDHGDLG